MADALTVTNLAHFPVVEKYEALLFSVNSQEFKNLAGIVGYDQARIIQHYEHLFSIHRKLTVPNDFIFRHIVTPARFQKKDANGKLTNKNKCLLSYMGIPERTLFRRLDSISAKFRFKKDNHLDLNNLPFGGKYYLRAYLSVDSRSDKRAESELRIYRNAPKLDKLYKEIKSQIKPKKVPNGIANIEQQHDKLAVPVAGLVAVPLAVPLAVHKAITQELQESQELKNFNSQPKTENKEPLPLLENIQGELTEEVDKNQALTPPCAAPPSPSSEAVEYITNQYDDPFTVYSKLMLHHYGITVDFDKNIKGKLEQLRSNFNKRVQAGQFLDLDGTPRDVHFNLAMDDIFDRWKQVEKDCRCAWEWAYWEKPEPKVFCSQGGEVLLDWFVNWFEEERLKERDKILDAAIEDARLHGFTFPK